MLSAKNPWNTVEVEDVGIKENEVVLYFKSDSSQEHRWMRRHRECAQATKLFSPRFWGQ